MRITIEIDVPGLEEEQISVTTGSGTGTGGSDASLSDGGSPPAEMVEQYSAARDTAADEMGWTDAGPAPEPPGAEGNGERDTGMASAEDVGGPPQA
jgi:hypothetical protein